MVSQNKVFQGLAQWAPMSMGWFFGFSLPLLDKLLSRKRSTIKTLFATLKYQMRDALFPHASPQGHLCPWYR